MTFTRPFESGLGLKCLECRGLTDTNSLPLTSSGCKSSVLSGASDKFSNGRF